MANIWKQNRDVSNKPKRNNFDLSFQSHSTFKFGYLYPVFRQAVVPGDSFRIDSAFDLKMMPVEFPVQSRIRAHMHYFYVRNKNLWKHWEDWLEGLKSNDVAPHPYLVLNDIDVKTGSIHDFMGLPTTLVNKAGLVFSPDGYGWPVLGTLDYSMLYRGASVARSQVKIDVDNSIYIPTIMFNRLSSTVQLNQKRIYLTPRFVSWYSRFKQWLTTAGWNMTGANVIFSFLKNCQTSVDDNVSIVSGELISNTNGYFTVPMQQLDLAVMLVNPFVTIPDAVFESINTALAGGNAVYTQISFRPSSVSNVGEEIQMYYPSSSMISYRIGNALGFQQLSDLDFHFFDNNNLMVSALPYRAYESIYRAYYANDVLQPLIINGEKEYNKFITTDDDGMDNTGYHLFRRNYELDFLTSCLPSPQAGPAPLVGMSALGDITVEDENGITTAHAEVDDAGRIVKVAVTSPLASTDHARTLMNIASVGMSINDFRSGNALQLFLEQTMRSGYRYINFIKGHHGVEPGYRALDMPEFIGGFSRDVDISTVVSQADTLLDGSGKALGEFSGLGRVVGGSNSSITHYCDDYGWIIGIMCVTPTPAYSQLCPKELICPTNYLDYYFEEFSQLGMQPVTYKEVAPLQSFADSLTDSSKRLEDTFGYQRPNYDMVARVDEVHGEFRSSLRQQLINRIFAKRPELGTEFLEINPSEINDIFINQNPDDDVFIGHLAFKVNAKRPLPRVHMPSLGR